jgi:hypothetical protein
VGPVPVDGGGLVSAPRPSADPRPRPVEAPRVLVTLHYPLPMHCAGKIMQEVARAYPGAVVRENGEIWSGRS